MSAGEIAALAASLVVAVGGIIAWRRDGITWLRNRRTRTDGINHLLHGKEAEHDAQGNLIDPGYPAISVAVRDLTALVGIVQKQLMPNGGSSIADQITAIHSTMGLRLDKLDAGHRELVESQADIKTVADQNYSQLEQVKRLAGEAATVAARVEDTHRRDFGRLDGKLDDLREKAGDRFDVVELEARTFRAVLTEFGFDLTPDDEDEDDDDDQ